jgi:hypothetical protein
VYILTDCYVRKVRSADTRHAVAVLEETDRGKRLVRHLTPGSLIFESLWTHNASHRWPAAVAAASLRVQLIGNLTRAMWSSDITACLLAYIFKLAKRFAQRVYSGIFFCPMKWYRKVTLEDLWRVSSSIYIWTEVSIPPNDELTIYAFFSRSSLIPGYLLKQNQSKWVQLRTAFYPKCSCPCYS